MADAATEPLVNDGGGDIEQQNGDAFVHASYKELINNFLMMGWTAFGGPQAHIGMFETVGHHLCPVLHNQTPLRRMNNPGPLSGNTRLYLKLRTLRDFARFSRKFVSKSAMCCGWNLLDACRAFATACPGIDMRLSYTFGRGTRADLHSKTEVDE